MKDLKFEAAEKTAEIMKAYRRSEFLYSGKLSALGQWRSAQETFKENVGYRSKIAMTDNMLAAELRDKNTEKIFYSMIKK